MPLSKISLLKTGFIVIILSSFLSCKKNELVEKATTKKDVLTKKNTEEIEAYFFIAASNVTKSIIAKSQLAQHKSLKTEVKDISTKIENNQNLLLQEINKESLRKLIITTEVNSNIANDDLYNLIDTINVNFDKAFVNSTIKSLSEQIKLFESISKETQDASILKLVLYYLPKQYELLREAKKIQTNL
jgi:predicted outer membrane protein